MRWLIFILLFPTLAFGYKDTLRVNAEGSPADWLAAGDSATSDLWYNDNIKLSLQHLLGDDGTEQHLFEVEDLGGAYAFYGAGATVDEVVIIWEYKATQTDGDSSGCRINVIIGNDTTHGPTRSTSTVHYDTLMPPSGHSWGMESVDSIQVLIDGEADLGLGASLDIDYLWIEVTYSLPVTTSGLHSRYLNILFDHDSAFTFNAFEGKASWRVSLDMSRTNSFQKIDDTLFLWKQIIDSKPDLSGGEFWADTFTTSYDGVDITNAWYISTGETNTMAVYLKAKVGETIQKNYTTVLGDSIEYYSGRICGTGNDDAVFGRAQGLYVTNSAGDSLNAAFDTLRFNVFSYGLRMTLDSASLDTITYPIEITVPFNTARRPLYSYGAVPEGGQWESFVWNGPTGSTLDGMTAWVKSNATWPSDSACFYYGLWADCDTLTTPETVIQTVLFRDTVGMLGDKIPRYRLLPFSPPIVMTKGTRYWVGTMKSLSAGTSGASAQSPNMFTDNMVVASAPDNHLDTTKFVSVFTYWYPLDSSYDSLGDLNCGVIGVSEFKTSWYALNWTPPQGPIFRNGGVYRRGVTVRGTK